MEADRPPYHSIISHSDLDGVACASLCSKIHGIKEIRFTTPGAIDAQFIDDATIVCDLPYSRACALWFDHHMANLEELRLRGIEASQIPGRLEDKASCAQVIYDYYRREHKMDNWKGFIDQVNIVDSFLYSSPEQWLERTPARILDVAIRQNSNDNAFLKSLCELLQDGHYVDVSQLEAVATRANEFFANEQSQIELIRKTARFLDANEEIIHIDLTNSQNPPFIQKNLAFTIHPGAKTVLETRCRYERRVKTNDIIFSMSLGFVDEETKKKKDLGDIMRVLNAGSGHPGSAAGQKRCGSKNEREKALKEALIKINDIWQKQQ